MKLNSNHWKCPLSLLQFTNLFLHFLFWKFLFERNTSFFLFKDFYNVVNIFLVIFFIESCRIFFTPYNIIYYMIRTSKNLKNAFCISHCKDTFPTPDNSHCSFPPDRKPCSVWMKIPHKTLNGSLLGMIIRISFARWLHLYR